MVVGDVEKHLLLLVAVVGYYRLVVVDYYWLVVVGRHFRHPVVAAVAVAAVAAAAAAAATTAAWKHPLLLGVWCWWHQELAFWQLSSSPAFSGMMGFFVVAWVLMQSRA